MRQRLVSVVEQAGLSLTWSQPKTGFLVMRLKCKQVKVLLTTLVSGVAVVEVTEATESCRVTLYFSTTLCLQWQLNSNGVAQ